MFDYERWLENRGMANRTGRKRVAFTLRAPEAREVYLCGSFNDWDLEKTPMRRSQGGNWTAQVLLPPGSHEYRFRVDGEWADDPGAETCVPNTFGGTNCVRTV